MQSKKNKTLTRRDFFKIGVAGTIGLSVSDSIFGHETSGKKVHEMLVYIGTYTSGKSKSEGIYIYKLNLDFVRESEITTFTNSVVG